MENHSDSQVIGSPAAPYQTMLARSCGSATRYATVGSPSLPNYIGATAGATFGIHDDAAPSAHVITADNLFRQVRTSGRTERSYEESMTSSCSTAGSGLYAVKHNPAAYFVGGGDRAACLADDVPLGTPTQGRLADDLAHDTLPAFGFITPNLCDDTHDCSVSTGDDWLRRWLPVILASPAYRAGATAVLLTYDEPTPVPNVFIAPSTPPSARATAPIDHYALLRTTEEMLGLPLLGAAADAVDLRPPLGL
jgi:phospholipase C